MKNPKIAEMLKQCRKMNHLTVMEVSERLKANGIFAAPKTVYGWESGQTQPTANTLLVLCCMYHIDDVLNTFGYKEEDGVLILSNEEKQLIRSYRSVPEMQQAVKKLLSM